MSALQHVVVIENGTVFGPFATKPEAQRFADFATRAIDPAEVRVLCSPVLELLNWRDAMIELREGDDVHPF